MSAPAGWYPDPQHPVPGAPPQQRYWDGQAWTQHVAPIAQQQAYAQPGYAPVGPSQPAYGQPATYAGQPQPPRTPDGVPLAGWWHRVGAYFIDALILSVIVVILAFPLIRDMLRTFGDFVDQAMTAAENGSSTPPPTGQFELDLLGPAIAVSAISLAVNLVYTVAFLLWKQATPGKLAVGLRIRLRETPTLPLPTVLLRWVTQFGGPGLLGLVPFIGSVTGIYSLVNALWPLWDDKNQALHDKIAKTNVVRVR